MALGLSGKLDVFPHFLAVEGVREGVREADSLPTSFRYIFLRGTFWNVLRIPLIALRKRAMESDRRSVGHVHTQKEQKWYSWRLTISISF